MTVGEWLRRADTLLAGTQVRTIIEAGTSQEEQIAAWAQAFPEARIWAFEPAQDAYEALADRLRGVPTASVVPCALADRAGPATLYTGPAPAGESLLPPGSVGLADPGDAQGPNGVARRVIEAETLDGFCAREGIQRIDILRLDVRGSELLALQGATDLLRSGSIELISLVVLFRPVYQDQSSLGALESFLGGFGYRLFDLYDLAHGRSGCLEQAEALFISETREHELQHDDGEQGIDPIHVQYVPIGESVLIVMRVDTSLVDATGVQVAINAATDGSWDGEWKYFKAPPLDEQGRTWALWDTRGFEVGRHLIAINLRLRDGTTQWWGDLPFRFYELT